MPFARRKREKRRKKGGGSKNDDSAAKKEPLWGTVAYTLRAGFGRVFAPEASRTRENTVFTCLSSGSGGVPWGTHARARGKAFLKHSMCFAQSAALQWESRPVWRGGPGTWKNINPGCFHGESLSGFSTMRHIPQMMLRRQASTKINLTR